MTEGLVLFAVLVVAIVVTLGVVSLVLQANAKPSGEDLRVLTSAHDGERVVAYRVCNALMTDAVADLDVAPLTALGARRAGAISDALNWVARQTGGLWVGGRVFLTSHRIVFMPNGMNRAVHRNVETFAVELKNVTGVRDRFGLVTRIVEIEARTRTVAIRAHGARAFADQIRAAAGSAGGLSAR